MSPVGLVASVKLYYREQSIPAQAGCFAGYNNKGSGVGFMLHLGVMVEVRK